MKNKVKFQYFVFVPLPKNHGLNKICDYAWPRFSGIYMESLLIPFGITYRRYSVLHTEGINIKSHLEFIFGVVFAFCCLFYEIDTLSRVSVYSVLRALRTRQPLAVNGALRALLCPRSAPFSTHLLRPVYQKCAALYNQAYLFNTLGH